MGFSDLKKNSNIDRLSAAMDNLDKKKNFSKDDDRYWKLTVDKAGTGHAVIRFLPAPDATLWRADCNGETVYVEAADEKSATDSARLALRASGDDNISLKLIPEDLPFVRIWDHGFQGPGGWYIEKSLTTLDQKDPVSEYNSKLWNAGDQDGARKQKRRLSYYSNILVVDDPANPENNGKVFLFKYGKKIFDKIQSAISPEFSSDEAFDPFNLWTGANFKLRAKQVAGYRNYDSSEFSAPAELGADDAEREATWNREYSLQSLIAPNEFKTYEELSARLNQVLGLELGAAAPTAAPAAAPAAEAPSFPTAEESVTSTDDGDDDGLGFFNDLLND